MVEDGSRSMVRFHDQSGHLVDIIKYMQNLEEFKSFVML